MDTGLTDLTAKQAEMYSSALACGNAKEILAQGAFIGGCSPRVRVRLSLNRPRLTSAYQVSATWRSPERTWSACMTGGG